MKAKNVVVLKTNASEGKLDGLKWLIAITLVLAGLVANYYYSEISMPLRVVGWLVVFGLAAFIAAQTEKGRWALGFVSDSRMELRKVTWPTRQETTQTTLVVAVMVVILALVLWGMDSFLVWLVGWLTGQHS